MPTHITRIRKRIVPTESGSNVILGKIYPGIIIGGVPTGNYSPTSNQTLVYNYLSNRRWERAQVCMDNVHPGPPYRSGGDFSLLSYDWCAPYDGVHMHGTYERADKLAKYVGGFQPTSTFSKFGVIDKMSFAHQSDTTLLKTENNTNHPSMDGLGDKAWKSTKPKLEKAGGAVFGAETRDLPRMLKSTGKRFHEIWKAMGGYYTSKKEVAKGGLRLMQPKKVADDFLNQQFGWAPFVGDLIKFNKVVTNYHDIIAKSIERNDRWVRRRVPLHSDSIAKVIESRVSNQCLPVILHASYWSTPPTYTVSEVETTTISAVGKFRYYRPEFDVSVQDNLSQWNSMMQFLTVSGLRVTPSSLYNATPWTWLIDWFANVGDYMDHLTDIWIDSVACQYCFVMQHQKTEREFVQELPFHSGARSLTFRRVLDSKQRRQGTSPYAFGLTWDDLSPRQLAIAAALGMTRR